MAIAIFMYLMETCRQLDFSKLIFPGSLKLIVSVIGSASVHPENMESKGNTQWRSHKTDLFHDNIFRRFAVLLSDC